MSDTRSGTRKKQFVLMAAVPAVTAQCEIHLDGLYRSIRSAE